MKTIQKELNGAQSFNEALLNEAEMVDLLGGDGDESTNYGCTFILWCN